MLNVKIIRTIDELSELNHEWSELIQDMTNATIFLTVEWVMTWWKHYGDDYELYVLVARDTSGKLKGIAPLMCDSSGWGLFSTKRLTFIGTGLAYPAHLDILARSKDREAVLTAFMTALQARRKDWDLLELISLAESSVCNNYLSTLDGTFAQGYSMPCAYIALPEDWHTYKMNALSSKMRSQLRQAENKLQKDFTGKVFYITAQDPEQVAEGMIGLFTLSRKRWHDQDKRSAFDDQRLINFNLAFSQVALKNNWLRLSYIKVEDTVIAVDYCFKFGKTQYGYHKTFSLDWGKYSPGRLLQMNTIKLALKEGIAEFDMLHGVNLGGKARWNPSVRYDTRLRYSYGLKGYMLLRGSTIFDEGVQISRKYIPDSVRQTVSRLLPKAQW